MLFYYRGGLTEWVDVRDLKSLAKGRIGSSPISTIVKGGCYLVT